MPRTDTPRVTEHYYMVTTRSMRRKKKKEQQIKAKKYKQESPKSGVSLEQDSDYKRDHPKLFFPKINKEVKKQLQELETLEHAKALSKDLQIFRSRAAVKEKKMKAITSEALISYDIKRDVKDCPITATVGQLIKDNPLYRRQLKEMLAGKRRKKLPKVDTVADVTTDWEKKEFRFGKQSIIVYWRKVEHEGGTTQISEEYDSDLSNESEVDDAYTIDSEEFLHEDHPCANNNLRSFIIPCRPGVEEMHGSDATKSDPKTTQEI
ncbi:hypothetical protein AXG93_2035s1290 [Marchantia polymorpha subsp. ruderalis]|uniref:Uncharacterized protein n=1 Tax=Marchantia polymorpha subsp. ruderalis TaxID=1480154 RepID=A0A176VQ12_MARPO|nr:hypothetical protein AXG93_2035s1290 [Marchantia polymorpha subsp. ruderalis]